MKLLTHNFLSSGFLKGAKMGYPLGLKITAAKKLEKVDFNRVFVENMIPKLEYPALVTASKMLKEHFPDDEMLELPDFLPSDYKSDEDFLEKVYAALVGYEIVEGELECPDTKKKFPIRDGIPNMLVKASELEPKMSPPVTSSSRSLLPSSSSVTQ